MFNIAFSLIFAYLIGSIPTAFIFARVLKGIDIRHFGSGNVGATNVYRVVGKGPGVIVLVIDAVKGFLPVFYFPVLFPMYNTLPDSDIYKILIGIAAIAGHVWTLFLGFKGGKGVATTAGVVLAIIPKIFLAGLVVWTITVSIFRYVSVASMAAAISLPVFSLFFGASRTIVIFSVILCFMGFYKHKANIKRLVNRQEKKIF